MVPEQQALSLSPSPSTTSTGHRFTAIGAKSVAEGQPLTFTVLATDEDTADILSYNAEGLPDGSTFDPATKTFTWTPTVNQGQPAPYMVTFSVSDGTESDTEVVAITVTNVNQPPNPPTLSGRCG